MCLNNVESSRQLILNIEVQLDIDDEEVFRDLLAYARETMQKVRVVLVCSQFALDAAHLPNDCRLSMLLQ